MLTLLLQADVPWYAGVMATLALVVSGAVAALAKTSAGKRKSDSEVVTKVMEALSAMSGALRRIEEQLLEHRDYLRDLHQWHDVTDDDGVRIWYSRHQEVERSLEKMAQQIEKLVEVVSKRRGEYQDL